MRADLRASELEHAVQGMDSDRLIREPDRQALALTQAGVIRALVGHPVPLLGDVVTTSGTGLERHSGSRDQGRGRFPTAFRHRVAWISELDAKTPTLSSLMR